MTLDEKLEMELIYSNVKRWHSASYKGKGINVWNTEGEHGTHGKCVSIRIKDAAPECNLYVDDLSTEYINGVYSASVNCNEGKVCTVTEYLSKNKIQVVTRSVLGSSVDTPAYKAAEAYWEKIANEFPNVVFINCAGNDGYSKEDREAHGAFPANIAMYIGACFIQTKTGKVLRQTYSSTGENLDFMNFVGAYNGTSFAAPYTAGMVALLKQRYGKDISREEVYKLLQMMCQDLDEVGRDELTGWGVPILPSATESIYVTMGINEKTYMVEGGKYQMDTAPIIQNGRTFVPIVFICSPYNYDAEWNDDSKQVTITHPNDSTRIVLTIGSKIMYVNGKKVYMDCAPFIRDGRTFVPVRWVAENFGAKVDWIDDEQKVMILK